MMPPESSVSDAKIWSVTLESSITILEALFTLIYDFIVQPSLSIIMHRRS